MTNTESMINGVCNENLGNELVVVLSLFQVLFRHVLCQTDGDIVTTDEQYGSSSCINSNVVSARVLC